MKTKTTITEALQEIKTITARLEKKQNSVYQYLVRDARILDPLEKDGGSSDYIRKQRQAIADLRTRLINIRREIQSANLSHELLVNGITKTVSDWLTWRREVAGGEKTFIDFMLTRMRNARNEIQAPRSRATSIDTSEPPKVVVNIDEVELMKAHEDIEICLSELDGKLSLFNATTTIEV